jgi:predicted nucleic acid-binding protein
MRVMLDTNILLSALLSPLGPPAALLEAWERKGFTLVACEALIEEFRQVPARPFFRVRLHAGAAELLRDQVSGPVASDPKDSYLLALAEASRAEFLVTGDKQLLSLKQHKSTRIITPVAMTEVLKAAK